MQYSVVADDGNEYGPVDLQTLKMWVSEGRVQPHSTIRDGLANIQMKAKDMPELGLIMPPSTSFSGEAPPQPYVNYNREYAPVQQQSRLGGVIFWSIAALILSFVFRYGGIILSAWSIFDAFQAQSQRDPKSKTIWIVVLGTFVVVAFVTYLKSTTGVRPALD